MNHKYWISCIKFTCGFTTDLKDKIITAAPILNKFIGQNKQNLLNWIKKIDKNYKIEELKLYNG